MCPKKKLQTSLGYHDFFDSTHTAPQYSNDIRIL